MNNKLIIAGAGSGKTTFLVKEALSLEGNTLITTFTEANRDEIEKKILKEKKHCPKNIVIQTWFSFLLEHGVRPYQSLLEDLLDKKDIGFFLSQGRSGFRFKTKSGIPIYWGEKDFFPYYFTKDLKIYSDKISKFIFETNKKSGGEIINRISRIYNNIFIDEVQDLAGWDLEIVRLLFESNSKVLLVGDPRQSVYETNDSLKNPKYKQGKIKEYLTDNCKSDTYEVDEKTLSNSHRNNSDICLFSSNLYPKLSKIFPCDCEPCRNSIVEHEGIYLVNEADVNFYIGLYAPQVLRYSGAEHPELTFGISKGLTFDRVLIYPTAKIKEYLRCGDISKLESICARFYVAITRARYSVAIVCDYKDDEEFIDGIQKYKIIQS